MNRLFRGGEVHGHGRVDVLVDAAGVIREVAPDIDAEGAQVVEAAGLLVAPAFVDAHVHAVQTGFVLTQLDLRDVTSRQRVLDLVAEHAHDDGDVLLAGGWDETRWDDQRRPTAAELERAAPGRRVLLDRADSHSSVVSPALAEAVPGLEHIDGWSDDGWVSRDARHAVNAVLAGLVGPDQRLVAARHAATHFASLGIAAFHENAAPHIGPEYELDVVRQAAAETGLLATLYWGELTSPEAAERLGVAGLAGDLNVDGSIGSRTSALRSDYHDCASHTGHAYLDAEQIADHVIACTRAGVQAGFHCIGEAALDAIGEGFERAAEQVGEEAIRAARHRLEHVEMAAPEVIATLGRLGVVASVQPEFDALWGGPDRMYAERLGERWRGMNAFGSLHAAGVPLAFGSDSPVTAGGPWAAVRAAVHHWEEEQRLPAHVAFDAHTRGGWHAARHDDVGTIAVGAPAHLALWHCPDGLSGPEGRRLPELHPDLPLPTLARLVVGGRTIVEDPA